MSAVVKSKDHKFSTALSPESITNSAHSDSDLKLIQPQQTLSQTLIRSNQLPVKRNHHKIATNYKKGNLIAITTSVAP